MTFQSVPPSKSDSDAAKTIAMQLGDWVACLCLDQVPSDVQHIAQRCILDTLAVTIGGSAKPVSRRLRGHLLAHYGQLHEDKPGSSTLLGTSLSSSAVGAALVNGAAAHVLDFDDTSYAGVVHGSAVVLPAVLAAAEQADVTGKSFLEAFIAGAEVVYALGLTLSHSHYLKGWWATSTLGAIGAAAGSAKVLGLEAAQIRAAIALAAVQANGMIAMFGSDSKPLIAGQAARLGIECALLAASGFSAPATLFEDQRGFLQLVNEGIRRPKGINDLGREWRLQVPGIMIKRYPLCSAAHAAIEATENLIKLHCLNRSQIKSVTCKVPRLVKISLKYDQPQTEAQSQFSMNFAVGCLLAFGKLGPEQISKEVLDRKDLQEAMSKVAMVEAENLDGPEFQPHFPECTEVTIAMSDGRSFAQFVGAPKGMPQNPLSDAEICGKFRSCAAYAGHPPEQIENLLANIRAIQNLDRIRLLMHRVK